MSEISVLVELVKANHGSVMERLDGLEATFKDQRTFCDGRFDVIEIDVKKHDTTISRSKGMITVIGAVWGVILFMAALIAPIIWG